jgi:hypothetical protein
MKSQEDNKTNTALPVEVMLEIQKYPVYFRPSLVKYAQQGVSPSEAYEELKAFDAMT